MSGIAAKKLLVSVPHEGTTQEASLLPHTTSLLALTGEEENHHHLQRRTKITCTLGPACDTVEKIMELVTLLRPALRSLLYLSCQCLTLTCHSACCVHVLLLRCYSCAVV